MKSHDRRIQGDDQIRYRNYLSSLGIRFFHGTPGRTLREEIPGRAASIFDRVLHNEGSKAQTDCVLINASFAIRALEPQKKIEECGHWPKNRSKAESHGHSTQFLTLNQ